MGKSQKLRRLISKIPATPERKLLCATVAVLAVVAAVTIALKDEPAEWTGEPLHELAAVEIDLPKSWEGCKDNVVRLFGTLRFRHDNGVGLVRFGPDGRTVVSVDSHSAFYGKDGLKVWDTRTGDLLKTLAVRSGGTAVALKPDLSQVLAATHNSVRLFDGRTGETLQSFGSPHSWPKCAALSPNGQFAAVGLSNRSIIVWSTRTGRRVRTFEGSFASGLISAQLVQREQLNLIYTDADTGAQRSVRTAAGLMRMLKGTSGRRLLAKGHAGRVEALAFSPDSRRLMSGSEDGTVRIWDVEKGEHCKTLTGLSRGMVAVAWSPDGRLAAANSQDGRTIIWDAETGQSVHILAPPKRGGWYTSSLVFSPDGGRLLTGCGASLRLYGVESGDVLLGVEADCTAIHSVDVSPDGKMAVSGGSGNTVRLWDMKTGAELGRPVGHLGPVSRVAVTPDCGRVVSTSTDDSLRITDMRTGRELLTKHKWGSYSRAWISPDGRFVAKATGKNVILYSIGAGGLHERVQFEQSYLVDPLGFRRGGTFEFLWKALDFGRGFVGPKPTLKQVTKGHRWVSCMALSPDSRFLATVGSGGSVKLWNARTGEFIRDLKGHNTQGVLEGVAFSPDGQVLASSSSDGTVRLWDVKSGRPLRTLPRTKVNCRSLAFTPDGRHILIPPCNDEERRSRFVVRSVATGEEVREYGAWPFSPDMFALSPDGKTLATYGRTSKGACLGLWDVDSGKHLETLEIPVVVRCMCFTPNGRYIVTGNSNATITVWRMKTLEERYGKRPKPVSG